MSELILLLSADLDVQEAFEYYEDYQEGRGAVFLHHLESAFEQLRLFPESGAHFHGSYRRLLVPHFPYGVFYIVEARGGDRGRRRGYTARTGNHSATFQLNYLVRLGAQCYLLTNYLPSNHR